MVSWEAPFNGSYHSFVVSTSGIEETFNNDTQRVFLIGLTPGTLYSITVRVVYFNVSSKPFEIEDIPTCKYTYLLVVSFI